MRRLSRKSGNKDTRAQRIIEHVQLHAVNWVPPTPPDKRRYVNEPDLTPLPLVPMLPVHKQWGTAGDLVPSSISGTTVTTPETSGATEQVVDQPDSRLTATRPRPQYIFDVPFIGTRTKVTHFNGSCTCTLSTLTRLRTHSQHYIHFNRLNT